jgi:phage shock protein E
MSIFDLFKRPDFAAGLQEYRDTDGAMLLDVRTKEEYRDGHIKGSVNIPLQRIDTADGKIKDKDKPLYVYCLSGARSSQAVLQLRSMGYTKVVNIGGIGGYRGKIVRGNQ